MNLRFAMIGLAALAIPVSFIHAPWPDDLILQHVPTVAALVAFSIVAARFRPSAISFYCCLAFLWLHIIGARWLYTFVPYDDLARALTGHTLSGAMDWERNHYDRMVHLASGILGLPPLSEFVQRYCRVNPLAAALIAATGVLAIGAVYEVIEWQVAMWFSPETAESYDGQQGDAWDAQKDLALAGIGSLICLPFVVRRAPGHCNNRDCRA